MEVNKTVFICEDDKAIIEVMSLLLQELSATSFIPTTYNDIVDQVTKHNPCCIIMDLSIGNTSGATLIQKLRKNKATAMVPIILFSASASIEVEAQKLKVNGTLKKPFKIEDFKQLISQYLST